MSVRMGILALLDEGPSHGYQLKAAFEARTGGVWTVNVGQVYTTLDRLRGDGLVEPAPGGEAPEGGRDRRRWRITPDGKAEVRRWFDDAAVDPSPPRDELLVKVLLAFARSPAEALEVIDRQRVELYRSLHVERTASTSATSDDDLAALAAALMAEAVRARREADLRWLDHCESLLLQSPPRNDP